MTDRESCPWLHRSAVCGFVHRLTLWKSPATPQSRFKPAGGRRFSKLICNGSHVSLHRVGHNEVTRGRLSLACCRFVIFAGDGGCRCEYEDAPDRRPRLLPFCGKTISFFLRCASDTENVRSSDEREVRRRLSKLRFWYTASQLSSVRSSRSIA